MELRSRREICAAGRALRELGFIPAAAGNLSIRLDDGRILATPSGAAKGGLAPGDMVLLCADGTPAENGARATRRRRPACSASSEILMHLRIYLLRPDVRAVCHAHPPVATGFATAGRALDTAGLCEAALLLGAVPVAPYGTPGTPELPDSLAPYVTRANAVLLANHGVVTYGENLRTAVERMEIVEHCARVTLVAELAGGAKLLTRSQVHDLVASRKRYGLPPLPAEAIPWITADDRNRGS
ncbi:MAG TPA: class II aldolase/adducin family protein [Candidatus Acidoferrales bacterium]|nr:class II aldolase/adducin family protein [Candidatus Acidoferrales bacterium]